MADAAPQQDSLFPRLVAAYGLKGALSLLSLLNPNASGAGRALSATSLAGSGAQLAGRLGGIPALTKAGSGLGVLGGLAGTGYNIAQIANDPNLSRGQQVGHTGRAAADTIMSLAIPYYGWGKALSTVGQILEGSGSPQLRGLGRSIDYTAEPAGAKGFWSVVQGDASPAKAFKQQGGAEGLMLDTMGPVGIILRGLGVNLPFLHNTQTTGTMFRNELEQVMGKIPALRAAGLDFNKYNIDTNFYNGLTPEARQAGAALGSLLASYAGDAKKDPLAYSIQAQNILLNKFGNQMPDIMKQIQAAGSPGGAPQPGGTMPVGGLNQQAQALAQKMGVNMQPSATQATQFQPGLPNTPTVFNKLQGILGLLRN